LRLKVTGAKERLDGGRQQAESALARVVRKEKLFSALDNARMAGTAWVDTHFDHDATVVQYAAAFADHGLVLDSLPISELARRIKRRGRGRARGRDVRSG
jgi:hypothetical protein